MRLQPPKGPNQRGLQVLNVAKENPSLPMHKTSNRYLYSELNIC